MSAAIPNFKPGNSIMKIAIGTSVFGVAYEFIAQPFAIGYAKMCGFPFIPQRNLVKGVPCPPGAVSK
jgi:hypothetical protein